MLAYRYGGRNSGWLCKTSECVCVGALCVCCVCVHVCVRESMYMHVCLLCVCVCVCVCVMSVFACCTVSPTSQGALLLMLHCIKDKKMWSLF